MLGAPDLDQVVTSRQDLIAALRQAAGYVTVRHEEKPEKLTLYGRQPERMHMGSWKMLRGYLLKVANGKASTRPWKVDVSFWYFIDESAGDLQRCAWRLIFSGKDIATHYHDICRVVQSCPKVRSTSLDTIEVPLPGGADRHSTAGGKRGAGPAGSVLVGAAAVARKMQGG